MDSLTRTARKNFGLKLQKLLTEKDMTQGDLANGVGLHNSTISSIVRGRNTVAKALAEKMAGVLSLSKKERETMHNMAVLTFANKDKGRGSPPSETKRGTGRTRKHPLPDDGFDPSRMRVSGADEASEANIACGDLQTESFGECLAKKFSEAIEAQGFDVNEVRSSIGIEGGAILVTSTGKVLKLEVSATELK